MTRESGAQTLMRSLRDEGVDYVFGIPGATEIRFMDALERVPDIRYLLGLHEVVCVGMAEGYARASGKTGLLNLHTASGLAAAGPLLYNAALGKVPLVVTVGQNDTRLLQRDPHLTGDIVGLGDVNTKWSTELVHAHDIPTVVHRAFKMARQAPSGPALVSIPQNVLEQDVDAPAWPAGPNIVAPVRPDEAALEAACAVLAGARKPLLLVESGVARSGAVEEVVRFAEIIGARVHQAWMSDVNFPVSHPQYLGDLDPAAPSAREVFAGCDVLVGVGCSLFAEGFLPNSDPLLPAGLKVVHIDEDPWEIGKNLPTTCGLQGDIKTTLAALNDMLVSALSDEARREAAARRKRIGREKAAAVAAWEEELQSSGDGSPISINRLLRALREVVRPDTVVVDEAWSASAALRRTLPLDLPHTFFRARQGGSIGSGLPMALGVKLGLPDKEVLAMVGDGSAAWSMQSLWTAARYRIPVTFVITNNATYRQVKLVRKAVLGDYPLDERHEGMDIDRPVIDFRLLAQSMGVTAERVTHAAGLATTVRQALDAGEPRLVEVMVESAP